MVTQPFAMGVFETTYADFDRMLAANGQSPLERSRTVPGSSSPVSAQDMDRHPVTGVAWDESVAYLDWLSRETGHRYRLPSEAEWEYAARAGSSSRYPFGDDPSKLCSYGNVADKALGAVYRAYDVVACSDGFAGIAPVGRFEANAFGLHDMLGNVKEWVADCWRDSYRNAPATGQARGGACEARAVRGGAWDSTSEALTVSYRTFSSGSHESRGFRVVREL